MPTQPIQVITVAGVQYVRVYGAHGDAVDLPYDPALAAATVVDDDGANAAVEGDAEATNLVTDTDTS